MATKREKPLVGHKRAGLIFGVTVKCECGKTFGPWYGKGASANAHAEWRYHVDECRKETK